MSIDFALIAVVLVCGQPADVHQTKNFSVYASTPEAAKKVGDAAEKMRSDLAKLWLGKSLPDWPFPCRIEVDAKSAKVGGFTDVSYSQGKVLAQKIVVRGPMERILKGPLAHELAHVIFAHHFGSQPPRWADEGGAILSEDDSQGAYQRKKIRILLVQQRQFPLRDFLAMRDYPDDLTCFYAQGHSLSHFLVAAKGHKAFLAFVHAGMRQGWDKAAQEQYGQESVEEMEKNWLAWVRTTKADADKSGTLQRGTDAECP